MTTQVDRAAAVRAALRALVAEHGFHGASMSAVAKAAGVATGTAYTHYESKDALVLAAYAETKAELGAAVVAEIDPDAPPARRFRAIWMAAYRYLSAHPDEARFMLQVDDSPYRARAHEAVDEGDPLLAEASAPDVAAHLLPLPLDVLYELGFAPVVRLAASGLELTTRELELAATGCWRAITKPAPSSVPKGKV